MGWEDVVPVAQSDGPNPVVSINYSTDCKIKFPCSVCAVAIFPSYVLSCHLFIVLVREVMDLFRAVLISGEKTQRVLELTEEILETNAANYTVWYEIPS
jgi:hypothetical protein